jgi:hypothetical protein
VPEPLSIAAVRLWLEWIERAYGPDVPLMLVSPWGGPAWAVQGLPRTRSGGASRPPRVPIVELLLDYGGGQPQVLLIAEAAPRNGGPPAGSES